MNRSRAWRRWQAERRKRDVRHWAYWAVDDPRLIGIYARTPAHCSCDMCGNPRRHWGAATRQERKADWALQDEIYCFMRPWLWDWWDEFIDINEYESHEFNYNFEGWRQPGWWNEPMFDTGFWDNEIDAQYDNL